MIYKTNPEQMEKFLAKVTPKLNAILYRKNFHTFPNGAVQGGAYSDPAEWEAKKKELGIIPLTPEERYANLLAAFGENENG